MIDPHCSPEVEGIIAFGQSTGVPMIVTSTIRPGATTIVGALSFHAVGQAVDFAGPHPTVDSDVLADIFHAFLPVEKHLAELIYAGPQVSFNIKNGVRVGKYAQSIHHNHVHVAVAKGVDLARMVPTFTPDTTIEVAPNDDERNEDMADPIGGVCAPGGGVWVATRDGGVRAYRNAPFYGSVPALKPENRQVGFPFTGFEPGSPEDPNAQGYTIYGADGAHYHFDQGVYDAIQRGEM